jgi:hypothetical protein
MEFKPQLNFGLTPQIVIFINFEAMVAAVIRFATGLH